MAASAGAVAAAIGNGEDEVPTRSEEPAPSREDFERHDSFRCSSTWLTAGVCGFPSRPEARDYAPVLQRTETCESVQLLILPNHRLIKSVTKSQSKTTLQGEL